MIVGVTGHQNLGAEDDVSWTRTTLREALASLPISSGLTSLAVGADQIFAELLIEARIPYALVLPCAGYENSFGKAADLERFQSLMAQAHKTHQLPFSAPCEEAYFAAGKWIVMHCELLIAIWNGRPARGLGGTADVVKFAQAETRPILHINPVEHTTHRLMGPDSST